VARTNTYEHFCVIARSLELIGEKWSLLIVRDLLRGPQRFTDLMRYMGGVTPKWLTIRLRDMEAAGIVERDHVEGRREVWYRLTPKGRDLAPVVESLAVWGIEHATRDPLPGEPVHPEMYLQATALYLNRREITADAPVLWEFRFPDRPPVTLQFDGQRWSSARAVDNPALVIHTTAEELLNFLNARGEPREAIYARFRVDGDAGAVEAFARVFRRRQRAARR
jgi:DNA-binding HxlR family transcriptional regulator